MLYAIIHTSHLGCSSWQNSSIQLATCSEAGRYLDILGAVNGWLGAFAGPNTSASSLIWRRESLPGVGRVTRPSKWSAESSRGTLTQDHIGHGRRCAADASTRTMIDTPITAGVASRYATVGAIHSPISWRTWDRAQPALRWIESTLTGTTNRQIADGQPRKSKCATGGCTRTSRA